MSCSAQIPVALQKLLDVWPAFNSFHKFGEPRILLEPRTTILSQLFIMAYLIEDQIRVGNLVTNHERARLGQVVRTKMLVESLQKVGTSAFLMLGVSGVFVVGEEGDDEQCAPCIVLNLV